MKIVHIIPSLSRGGAERFVVDLCNALAKIEETDVYLVSLRDNQHSESFVSELDRQVNYISFGKKAGFDPKVLLKVSVWINKIKPDIVNTHTSSFEYVNLNLSLRLPSSTKYFQTVHNQAARECPNPVLKSIRKKYYQNNRVVPITISQDGKATFRTYYNLDNDVTIVNGRPDLHPTPELPTLREKFAPKENEYLFLNVGRVVEAKNQAMLIRSVQAFNIQVAEKKCRLLIIGDMREEQVAGNLRELVKNDPYIELIGARDNIVDYLSIADTFCLSSHYEGMPISLIEALSLGCIPICTAVGGIPEMITDGVNGFLSNEVTEKAYLDAIMAFHLSGNKAHIAENGIKTFAQNYHIRATAEKYHELYRLRMMSN
ncbi:glycosyltransferase [Dyadobacter chenhuakuii]|uniref:Glycosyltransferase n=1 Tax=Dyadobacter chenhuakuii TaxID=2909339 RepID=A0A9X1TT81_9BACT|nr:glycosyltransferase [Dyadobacter chenhuakuii]MCF2498835.1 glycosyltransferase [Dyadobacter chenhuakuii]